MGFGIIILLLCALTQIMSVKGGCYTYSPKNLTATSGKIVFNGTLMDTCIWQLPVPASNNYAYTFILESLNVWDDDNHTYTGCLTIPGYQYCGPYTPYCAINPSALGFSKCDQPRLQEMAARNPFCQDPVIGFEIGKVITTIELAPEGGTYYASNLTLTYAVHDCSIPFTTTPETSTTGSAGKDACNAVLAVFLPLVVLLILSRSMHHSS